MKFILVLALISVEIAASHEDKSKHHRHKISKEAPHEKDLQRKSVRIHPEHQPTIFPPDDHNEGIGQCFSYQISYKNFCSTICGRANPSVGTIRIIC